MALILPPVLAVSLMASAGVVLPPSDPQYPVVFAFYLAQATAICATILSATVVPTALVAPPGTAGGPVTGTGTLS